MGLPFIYVRPEAKKHGKLPNDIIAAEIDAKVGAPGEPEIRAAYNANKDQLGGADLETVRSDLVNYLRNQQKQTLYGGLVNRLKMTNVVSKSADVNAANLAPGAVLVSVNGDPLRVDAINERMKTYSYKMQMRIYSLRKDILDRRINDLLIVAEANKRKIQPNEIVRTEITEKLKAPTDAEIAKFYEQNKANIKGDLAEARPRSRATAATATGGVGSCAGEQAAHRRQLKIFLREPPAPVVNVNRHGRVAR
jgi:hypothetical protein